jgi:murein endopeptidase
VAKVSREVGLKTRYTPIVGRNKGVLVQDFRQFLQTARGLYEMDHNLECRLVCEVQEEAECVLFATGMERDGCESYIAIL